jgi:putative ABC transport system permease protein
MDFKPGISGRFFAPEEIAMKRLRRALSRFLGAFAGRRRENDLAAELESHIRMQTDDNLRLGMPADEARRAAMLKFGSVESAKESMRDQRGLPNAEAFLKDIRYAGRGIRKNPGFAAAVILTLALGIGANTAIFSVVYAVLLKPLPYASPEQIYAVEVVVPERTSQFASLPVTVQAYLDWRKAETAFPSMTVLRPWECNLTGDAEPERLGGARVSANFFSFLGVPVARGREFYAAEEQPGKEHVVVISDQLWRRRYGADPAVIGRAIDINGEPHQVVGIADPSLLVPSGTQLHSFLPFAPRIDLWKPIAPTPRELENESWDHGLLVRLPQHGQLEHGRQQLQTMLNALIRTKMPDFKSELLIQLAPVREVYSGKIRLGLLLVLAASGLLLLTACVNIANLFLARVASRASEFATKIALGAGRTRIVSQMLTESMVLAMLGGALGAAVATYGAALLAALGPAGLPLPAGASLNLPVLSFALAASLATGIACGLFPAWQAYRKDAAAQLQESARAALGGSRAARFRRLLVGTEMALGTVLLASTALLLHSFVKIMRADRGYEVERVLAVDLSLFGERYAAAESRVDFYRTLTQNVQGLPGILAAGAINGLPASGSSGVAATIAIFRDTDTDFPSAVLERPVATIRSVTAGYFAASRTALIAGRFLAPDEPTLVAVVSESLANRLWPGESAASVVGRTFRQGNVQGPLITVVGVAQDVRAGAVDQELISSIYRPHGQWASGPMTMVVRTAREPADMAAPLRAEIRNLDANLPIPATRTMQEIVSASVAERRFQMLLTSLFALAALLLGAVGIYGVVSYAVASRTREVGLRIALGAMKSDVMRWVFAQGMKPVLVGLAAGLAGAIAIARALRNLLFEITPTDPLALGSVALILLLTSGLACYLPARRASRMDPIIALRHE